MIKINKIAPDFKIPSTNNKEYSLKQSKGNYVVLYFYSYNNLIKNITSI